MSKIALYRKYRPESFKDILGQDHIVKVIGGALKLGNIAHAYLFCGSRGTGKTSIARILARELGTKQSDLYEIDAASNTGVDDIRELNESVATLPLESKYKIYILDEVHMLSKSAFNALLKTLEEPPKHVIFILATTEKEKVPVTVLSRCETHIFRKPTHNILKKSILDIANAEGYKMDSSGADLIATLGDGSFRDAQGILQKIISYSKDKEISHDEISLITGAPSGELINRVIEAVDERNAEKGIQAVKEASEDNIDMKVFATLILDRLRKILLLKYAPNMKDLIKENYSKEDFEFLEEISKTGNIKSGVLLEFLNAYTMLNFSSVPESPLEVALIKLCGEE